MFVIAFDGIMFDTLDFRATAVVDALAAEGIGVNNHEVLSVLPTRSLAEAVRAVVHAQTVDETTLDLVALRAERTISEIGSRGAQFNAAICDRLRRAAAVTRIVVRADSPRRTVEQLLALADLESLVSFVCCSDDLNNTELASDLRRNAPGDVAPQQVLQSFRSPSVERSYAHIVRRMYSNRGLLGTAACIGVALEVGDAGRAVARGHGFVTPESFAAAALPGL